MRPTRRAISPRLAIRTEVMGMLWGVEGVLVDRLRSRGAWMARRRARDGLLAESMVPCFADLVYVVCEKCWICET